MKKILLTTFLLGVLVMMGEGVVAQQEESPPPGGGGGFSEFTQPQQNVSGEGTDVIGISLDTSSLDYGLIPLGGLSTLTPNFTITSTAFQNNTDVSVRLISPNSTETSSVFEYIKYSTQAGFSEEVTIGATDSLGTLLLNDLPAQTNSTIFTRIDLRGLTPLELGSINLGITNGVVEYLATLG